MRAQGQAAASAAGRLQQVHHHGREGAQNSCGRRDYDGVAFRYRADPRTYSLQPGNHVFDGIPCETAIGIFDFRPEDMVGKFSPRPHLLLHPTNDSVTPVSETVELFRRAGTNTGAHLLADVDHFMFSEGRGQRFESSRVRHFSSMKTMC